MTGLLLQAAVAGLLQAAALAWPFEWGFGFLQPGQPSGLLQLATLLWLALELHPLRRPRDGALVAWVFATCWLLGTFWWLFISMHRYGDLPAWMAALAVLALAAALALYYAACIGWLTWLGLSGWRWALGFATAWSLAELMRGQWLTGFPWGAVGYAHVDSPLATLAPWVGAYGVGWAAVFLAGAGATRAWKSALLVVILTAAGWWAGYWGHARWGQDAGQLRLTLLQGNIAQNEKFVRGKGVEQSLSWYAQELRMAGPGLVVAPETAIPLLPGDLPHGYLEDLGASTTRDRALLTGIPLGNARYGYTNSALGLSTEAGARAVQIYRYDKHHLVPFGEFIPPMFRWFTGMMNIPLGDFNRGDVDQQAFAALGQRIAPNICYEDLFGEELANRYQNKPTDPTIMVNMSNIAWFGDSTALDQHLQISRMRTLEFQRPMVRATNTGTTAVIDHRGQVTRVLPKLQQSKLHAWVEGRKGDITPYARWAGAWGLWPMWAVLLLLAMPTTLWVRRQRLLEDA